MADFSLGTFQVTQRVYLRDDLGRFLSAVHEGAHNAAWELADTLATLVIAAIAGELRVRTGELIGSVKAVMVGATEGVAVSDSDHAAPLEFGAAPHYIPPRVVPPGPMHPGNRAYKFFEAAGKAVTAMSGEIVARNMPK
jgi:hypothetical protein